MSSVPVPTVTASPAPTVTVPPVTAPDVSVVVVAYGTGPILIDSLESLVATTTSSDLSVELIVVSNPHPMAGRRSATELRLFTAGVRLVEPDRNVGFGGGCELGALVARGDVLAFVNPDVIARPGWLEPLVAVVRTAAAPTIAAPVLLEPDGRVQEAGQAVASDGTTHALTERPTSGSVVDVDYASAACWVMRRADHETLGGFDASYHPAYFEDVDLAWRCHRADGRCVVVAASSVVHDRGRGTPEQAAPADAQRDLFLRRWPEVTWLDPQANSRSTSIRA